MQIGRFRLGMRTFKSALSVFICLAIFHLFHRGEPLIAALAAVFSLRQDLTTTFSFGKSRILGNSIGGAAAILYLVLQKQFSHDSTLIELIVLPILVAVVIIVSDGFDNNAGIISAIATMLLITLSIPAGETVLYAFHRVLDTFIGTLVAVVLNFIIRPPEPTLVQEIQEDLVTLQQKEADLQHELHLIQEKIKEQQK